MTQLDRLWTHRLARLTTLLLLAALALYGLGHAPLPAASGADRPALATIDAAFLLPDGTAPVLCLSAEGAPEGAELRCDLCRLDGAGLAPHTGAAAPELVFFGAAAGWATRPAPRPGAALAGAAGLRGPPAA